MISYQNLTPEQEENLIQTEFNALLRDYAATSHKQKVELITKAFEFANRAHKGVKRRSGEPYIMHPLAVARIAVREIGLGSTSICSALLHDVVEDTDYTCEDIAEIFGEKIASIVDGLTKISGGIFGTKDSAQAENFRKLILTIPEDVRVILIKMADRLHNMRTLGAMPPSKQLKITGETQYIYAPLAQRLGFFLIKTELENLSFKYEQPKIYAELEEQISKTTPYLEDTFQIFINPITKILDSYNYEYEISSRIKTPYSVFKKMQKKDIKFEEVYDLLAARIIIKPQSEEKEKANCWVAYSAITSIYKPHPERTRDWINTPKSNGYEALHVTVMGPGGNWIEVQIRSERMNAIAERGIAAHWKYKTGEHSESDLDEWFKTIKDMLDDTSDLTNAVEFMDTFKMNLYSREIFLFTPKGDIKKLPIKATALDFAFYLHTDIGSKCIAAKVDHKLVPLSYELHSGEQVEIITSKTQEPKLNWLDITTTPRARTYLKSIFRKELKDFSNKGSKATQKIISKLGQTLTFENIQKLLAHYELNNINELYIAIGRDQASPEDIVNILPNLSTSSSNKWIDIWKLNFIRSKKTPQHTPNNLTIDKKKTYHITDINGTDDFYIAECCKPIPGDAILGYIEDDNTVTVHKCDCINAQKMQSSYGDRVISAIWKTEKVLSFLAKIAIDGIDEVGMLKNIATVISDDYSINMKKTNFESIDGVFKGELEIYVYNTDDITNLCNKLLQIKAVKSAKRIE